MLARSCVREVSTIITHVHAKPSLMVRMLERTQPARLVGYYSVIDIDYTLGHKKRAEQPLVFLELV
jgi:hypothetical protein